MDIAFLKSVWNITEYFIVVYCVIADEVVYSINDIKVVNNLYKLDSLKFTIIII